MNSKKEMLSRLSGVGKQLPSKKSEYRKQQQSPRPLGLTKRKKGESGTEIEECAYP